MKAGTYVIIVRCLLSLVLVTIGPFSSPRESRAGFLLDRIVAVVDTQAITWSELYKTMEFQLAERIQGLPPDERREFLERHEKDYLERLIDIKIQLTEARRLNVAATAEEIDAAVDQIRKKLDVDRDTFTEAIQRQGFTFAEYKQKIGEQITLSKIVNLEIRSKLIVTEEEISAYLDANPDLADLSEGYRVRQIFIGSPDDVEEGETLKRAREIMKHLEDGEPFEAVAQKYSDGPNAVKGGNLGFIRKNDLAESFVDVLEGLERGEFSEPFRSERGMHILYLEEKVTRDVSMRDRVREIVLEEKFRDKLKEWARSLRGRVFIEVTL